MLVSDLKLLLRFKTSSLYEEASGTAMYAAGDTPPQILPNGGYVMSNDQYLVGTGASGGGYDTRISDAFTFGFWLYPVNPGMATDPSSGDAVSISMPVMILNEVGSSDQVAVEITENTTVDGENNLTVSLNGGNYSASSEDYAPSVWHHFWIVYNGTTLSISVDGVSHNLQSEEGLFPAAIDGDRLDLYINRSLTGYAYNVAKNYGYISDIFLMGTANTSASNMQRVINNGIQYFVDDDYTNLDIEESSIYFNDPDTIIVTSSIADMSYVYIGRNDGKILRGSPLFWETRRSFANSGEADLLGLSIDDKGNSWDITPTGFLELKNTSIRL